MHLVLVGKDMPVVLMEGEHHVVEMILVLQKFLH